MGKINIIIRRLIPIRYFCSYLRRQGVMIGKDCDICRSASFGSEPYLIRLGNHVRVNAGVNFVTHDGGYWILRNKNAGYGDEFKNADKFGMISVKDNVHIGTNAIIMLGVTIGENVVIACGAVVTHDVPPNSIWGGVPAHEIESLEQYAEKARKVAVPTKSMSPSEKRKYLENMMNEKQ